MPQLTPVQILAVFVIPGIFAITVHEVAHGWVARRLGDRTAEMLGRLTLNPLKHIDPIGTIVIPAALLFLGLPPIGWAKPVPVAIRNFKNPQRDMAIVAAAGPISNMLMALGWALVARLAVAGSAVLGTFSLPLLYMGLAGVFFNMILAVLNLIPIPPLDGGRVLSGFLSPRASDTFNRIEPFGFPILLVLLWSNVLWKVMWPAIQAMDLVIAPLTGISIRDAMAAFG